MPAEYDFIQGGLAQENRGTYHSNVILRKFRGLWASDRFMAGFLFLIVILTRLPFQSRVLYHWDSVNFAYAVDHFDLASESPHPPGYIVYVWLVRVVNLIYNDPQAAMVTISIVASALAVVALFFLGKTMYNRQVGVYASLLLATSPIFWFYGEIALPHTLDALAVILSVWLLYKTSQGDYRYLYPAVITLAIAGGFRPQTLVFLLPLALYCLRKAGIGHIMRAGAVGAFVCLLWFVPLINASGGLHSYLSITNNFGARFQQSTSIFMGAGIAGFQQNAMKVGMYTLYGMGLAVIPLATIVFAWLKHRSNFIADKRNLFMMIWVAPVLFFYLAIHMGQQGLIFVFLPTLFLLASAEIMRLFLRMRRLINVLAGGILIFNIAVFTLLPEYPLGEGTQRMLTWNTLTNTDMYYQGRFDVIQQNFTPETTVVIAKDWRHAAYYLRDFTILPWDDSKWGAFEPLQIKGYLSISDNTLFPPNLEVGYIVLFDGRLGSLDQSSGGVLHKYDLPGGESLMYYTLKQGDRLFIQLVPGQLVLKED